MKLFLFIYTSEASSSSILLLVPDLGSRNVVLVRHTFSSGKPQGVRNLEWGGDGEGMGKGRLVYE